ncbi:MAG: SMC-Scp complex subunit ScpB [Thermoplasmata archaeon]
MLSENAKKVEAILFLYPSPCSYSEIMEKLDIKNESSLIEILESLKNDYESRNSALEVVYQDNIVFLRLKDEYKHLIKNFSDVPFNAKQLKIIVYIMFKEPVKQSDVINALGESYRDDLNELKKMKYIEVKKVNNSNILSVSNKFYKLYGVSGKDKMMEMINKK